MALLAPFRGQKFSVVCIAGDTEGKNIAEQIVTVLRAAGWDFPETGVAEAAYNNKEPIGLSLMVNAGQIMTPSVLRPVAMLVKALGGCRSHATQWRARRSEYSARSHRGSGRPQSQSGVIRRGAPGRSAANSC